MRFDYDLAGHVLKVSLFGTDGKPALSNTRYSIQENEYDNRGNRVSEKLFDTDGKPINCSAGWHTCKMVYDPATNYKTASYFYDTTGKQVSGEEDKHDQRGNVIERKYLGSEGQLQPETAVEHYEYDSQNRAVREWYTNQSGAKVTKPNDTYNEARYKYDQNGNVSEMTYWSASGSPVMAKANVHKVIKEYNGLNQMIHWVNLDTSGNAIKTSYENPPEARYEYDARGNNTVIAIFDGKGIPHNSLRNYQKQVNVYNERNKLVEVTFFDKDGTPVKEKDSGITRAVYAYDNHGNRTKEEYYDGAKLLRVATSTYNNRDNITELITRDGNGKTPEGYYSKVTWEYEADNTTPKKFTAYDANNKVSMWRVWDKAKKEWGEPNFSGGGGGYDVSYSSAPVSSGGSSASNWQQEFREFGRQCPMTIDENVDIVSVSVGSNSVTITYKLKNVSKYEIGDAELSNVRTVISGMRGLFGDALPSSVGLNVVVLDKAGRTLPI